MRLDSYEFSPQDTSIYAELRAQRNRETQIALVNGNLVSNNSETSTGLSARVWLDGAWGFASSPQLQPSEQSALHGNAVGNARFLAKRHRTSSALAPSAPFDSAQSFATARPAMTQRDKIALVQQLDSYIQQHCPKVSARNLVIWELDMEKRWQVNPDSGLLSQGYSLIPRSNLILSLTAEDAQGRPVTVSDFLGGLGQFEDMDFAGDTSQQLIDTLYQALLDKCQAVPAKGGKHTVVLDSALAGILAHEAIGHTTEADLVLAGSVAGDYLGQPVASDLVTLIDFAHTYQGQTLPVPVYIDDEGVEARDARIIEDGILKTFMHNRESAAHYGVAPTGNARAYQFYDEPLIRMRNTAFLPGRSTLSQMIASVEDGYYLCKTGNGQADTTSEFMFGITLGYEIKNGKLGRAITDTTISGIAFDVLKTIDMVSDEMSWESMGMCGKKQPIPVGMGGPAIRAQVHIGGQ